MDDDRRRVAEAIRTSGLLTAAGLFAELELRTVQSGEPFTSDFGI